MQGLHRQETRPHHSFEWVASPESRYSVQPGSLVPLLTAAALIASVAAMALAQSVAESGMVPATLEAPHLLTPASGTHLEMMGPVVLSWSAAPSATQYQLRVIPANNDGPGINLIIGDRTLVTSASFTIQPPTLGRGPYLLLPGMSYRWQVRVTDAPASVGEDDTSWGLWSEAWTFFTPVPNFATIQTSEPGDKATVTSRMPTLVWANAIPSLFYYEVQLSEDPLFVTDPAAATKPVYWNLVHGGQSRPMNSWTVPQSAALTPGTRYNWRVRPRVQGDGLPVAWSPAASFQIPRVEVVASHLVVPWALAFAPDGRLFFTQRVCELRVMAKIGGSFQLQPQPVLKLPTCTHDGDGVRGLALDPHFAQNHYLYLIYSNRGEDGELDTRLSRFTERDGRADDERILYGGIPDTGGHNAGRLKFGHDGRLYLTTGETGYPSLSQDLTSLAGKILRLNPNGSIPADNPIPGSAVYASGLRNPQGMAWHPFSGQLFGTDHGPSPGFIPDQGCCHDEVNRIIPGGNYGWPLIIGAAVDPRFVSPIMESGEDTWAPSGADFGWSEAFPDWKGSFFFAALRGEHLHRVILKSPNLLQVGRDERLFGGQFGRLRDVVQGPDGFLYFSTSNHDGRGSASPKPEDDRILRIVPPL